MATTSPVSQVEPQPKAALVQVAWYGAYSSLAIPVALIDRRGYEAGVPTGLGLATPAGGSQEEAGAANPGSPCSTRRRASPPGGSATTGSSRVRGPAVLASRTVAGDATSSSSSPAGARAAATPAGDRTSVRRLPENAVHDVAVLHAVLDAGRVAHVAVVQDGQPFVVPMACARDGDRLLLHGSTGSRLMTVLASGAPTCATVTLLDGLVYARSAFESSMHYRSAMVLGVAHPVPPERALAALQVLTERLLPGRWAQLRPPTRKELAATMLVELALVEWSVKVSDGPPQDPPEDLDATVWAGVLPLRTVAGAPVDAPDLRSGHVAPPYLADAVPPPPPVPGRAARPGAGAAGPR